jgi:hypothetical protein
MLVGNCLLLGRQHGKELLHRGAHRLRLLGAELHAARVLLDALSCRLRG